MPIPVTTPKATVIDAHVRITLLSLLAISIEAVRKYIQMDANNDIETNADNIV